MPLLRKGVLIPSAGVDWSLPSTFIDDRTGFSKNMRFYRNEMRKRPGKTLYGSAVSTGSQIMGLGKLELNNGSKFLIRNSKTKIQKFNTSTNTWSNISVDDFTGTDSDFFSYTNVSEDNMIIITNGKDAIRKWTGSGATASLGGLPPKAKFCTYLSPYLMLGFVDDGAIYSPWKVQWPDTGNPELWTGGNSGSLLLSDEPSPIKNIMKLNNYVAVYKQKSLALLQKVSTTDIFVPTTIRTGIGLGSSRCVVDAEGIHYFMGENDFYQWSGGQPESIGKAVRDEIFSRLDRSKIDRCFAIAVQELKEIWFFIVISGSSWPTEVWKFNYSTGFWYYDTCDEITAAVAWEQTSSASWDDDVGTWDDDLTIWDSGDSILNWEQIVFGNSANETLYLDYSKTDDDDATVDAYFESKDFSGDQLEFNKRWLQIDVWAKGSANAKLYVDYSIDYGSSWMNVAYNSSTSYISLDENYQKYTLYFDVVSDVIRFRFKNSESNEIFYIRNFYPYYLSQEQVYH